MIYLTRKSDRTIFFSSHHLSDVERVADYIAVFDRSVLRACCPLVKFQESVRQLRLRFPGSPPAIAKNSRPAAGHPHGKRTARHLRALQRRGGKNPPRPCAAEMETVPLGWRTRSSAIWASAAKRHSSCQNWRQNHESTDSKRPAGKPESGVDRPADFSLLLLQSYQSSIACWPICGPDTPSGQSQRPATFAVAGPAVECGFFFAPSLARRWAGCKPGTRRTAIFGRF
jgi:hypothetical protein